MSRHAYHELGIKLSSLLGLDGPRSPHCLASTCSTSMDRDRSRSPPPRPEPRPPPDDLDLDLEQLWLDEVWPTGMLLRIDASYWRFSDGGQADPNNSEEQERMRPRTAVLVVTRCCVTVGDTRWDPSEPRWTLFPNRPLVEEPRPPRSAPGESIEAADTPAPSREERAARPQQRRE